MVKNIDVRDNGFRNYTKNKKDSELIGDIGFGETVVIDKILKKNVLITAEHSYVGNQFVHYAEINYPDNFEFTCISSRNNQWEKVDFSSYDVILHVAGIAHSDIRNISESDKEQYYKVNTDLTIELAKKAKLEGVHEFIYLSSVIVYGESAKYGKDKMISENTVPIPANFYGDSKLQGDVAVRDLADDKFKVIVLRMPMVYGKNSKGNYPKMAKLAKNFHVFPDVTNSRSMLYIDNLCELLSQIMLIVDLNKNEIVLLPQNSEFSNTSQLVAQIANVTGNKMHLTKLLIPFVALGSIFPGEIGSLINKAFGNCCYNQDVSHYPGLNYQKVSLSDSIIITEKKKNKD